MILLGLFFFLQIGKVVWSGLESFYFDWSGCVFCVKRVVWERIGTAGRWVQGYKNCFPCEKKEHEWWKVKEVFLSGRERRRAVRGQRYTENERFHARLATSAVLLICAASKPFRRARLSPPEPGRKCPLSSLHSVPSHSSIQLFSPAFLNTESLFPSFYFP